jgi:predicted SAM-dependent methyltransferase
MNYSNSFNGRVESFIYAINNYEYCLTNELTTAVNILDIQENDILVNLGAAGTNINNFVSKNINYKYIPLEFNKEFANKTNIEFCYPNELPLNDNSVNKIIIMALLHHFNETERIQLYNECYRVLKPNGKLIISDVIQKSKEDIWLNYIVNKYNPYKHNGKFFDDSDSELITQSNFNVVTKVCEYNWFYNNKLDMFDFLKNYFYLKISDDDLDYIIKEYLGVYKEESQYKFDWKLIYFICTKN